MTGWQVRDYVVDPRTVADSGVVDLPAGWEPFATWRTAALLIVCLRRPAPVDTDAATER